MTAPEISIIVPSRDGRIDRLREELAKQSFRDYEIVVNTEPPNPAHARNQGALSSRGKYLVFFDDDVRLSHAGLLAELKQALSELPPLSILGARDELAPDATSFQRYAYKHYFRENAPVQKLGIAGEVEWQGVINGRCMAMTRETFNAIKGFDSGLIAGEDFEILYRLRLRGGKVYALNRGRVYFYPPKDIATFIKKTIWYEKGNSQVARKYPESRYRPLIPSLGYAAGYLLLRTVCLIPLCFIKVSFHHRKPVLCFRPLAAMLSYLGAWIYCWAWFSVPSTSKAARTFDENKKILNPELSKV